MLKPTEIHISDSTESLESLGCYGVEATREKNQAQVRKIFLSRKGQKPTPLSSIENISNTQPVKILGPNNEVIFEITKEDIESANKKAQIYLGLCFIIQRSHLKEYKEKDCTNIFSKKQNFYT